MQDSTAYNGTTEFSVSYVRDKLGRITDKTESIGGQSVSYHYEYDLKGRLFRVSKDGTVVSTYVYGPNGNRLSHVTASGASSGTYDNQDRLTSYGGFSYGYTANGELLSKTDTQSGETTSYTYDAFGNLTIVGLPDGTSIAYVIDGRNRRIGKKVNGVPVQGFLYKDQLNPIAEVDGSNDVVARFIYGERPNVPDYMEKDGVIYRIVSDHLDSPRLVIDVSSGAIAQRIDYDEFGNVINDTNPGFQPFGFAGGIYDRDTGLVRFGVRDYDAATGKWTSKDPIMFNGGDVNLFGYALNDPINYSDTNGLAPDPKKAWDILNGADKASDAADIAIDANKIGNAKSSREQRDATRDTVVDVLNSLLSPVPFVDVIDKDEPNVLDKLNDQQDLRDEQLLPLLEQLRNINRRPCP